MSDEEDQKDHECSECSERFTLLELELIDRSILDPGSPIPSGECPKCGCYCYPIEDETERPLVLVMVSGGLADIKQSGEVEVFTIDLDALKVGEEMPEIPARFLTEFESLRALVQETNAAAE